jgi:hypothetical protein
VTCVAVSKYTYVQSLTIEAGLRIHGMGVVKGSSTAGGCAYGRNTRSPEVVTNTDPQLAEALKDGFEMVTAVRRQMQYSKVAARSSGCLAATPHLKRR